MKNRLPGSCSVCKETVEPGEGSMTRVRGQWVVTHVDPCPTGERREHHAQKLIDQAREVLQERASSRISSRLAIGALGRVVATGWLLPEKAEEIVLHAPASRKFTRWEIEDLLERHFGGVRT